MCHSVLDLLKKKLSHISWDRGSIIYCNNFRSFNTTFLAVVAISKVILGATRMKSSLENDAFFTLR